MSKSSPLSNTIAGLGIAVCAYILYSTGGLQHMPELPTFQKGSPEAPTSLRTSELSKLTATGGYYQGRFGTQLYNGTDWTISHVDVTLTKIKTSDSRRFRLSPPETKLDYDTYKRVPIKVVPLKPYSKGTFEASIGDFLEGIPNGEWSWSVTAASGFQD